MRFLVVAAVALVPAAILPGYFFYFDITPKVILILLGAALALLSFSPSIFAVDGWPRRMTFLFAAQAAWLGMATVLSTHPALSLNGGNWRRFGFITEAAVLTVATGVIVHCAGRRDHVIQYLRSIVTSGIPVSAYGIAQYLGWDPLLPSAAYHVGEGVFTIVRTPSTMGHASYFGTYLVYLVFAGCALVLCDEVRGWKIAGACATVLAAFAIVCSGTRAAMAGMVIGTAILFWRLPGVSRRRTLAIGFAFVLCVLALVASPAGQRLRSRVHWSLEEPLGGARFLLWRDSVRMAWPRMAIGYGPETFATEFPRFESAELARQFPDFQHESPHNALIDALVSQGVEGSILLMATGAIALWIGLATPRRNRLMAALAAALIGGVVAQQFTTFTAPTALFFFVTVALIASLSEAATRHAIVPRWVCLTARGVTCAAALGFTAFAFQIAIADHALAAATNSLTHGTLDEALTDYAIARRWAPAGSSSDLYFSRELARFFRATPDVRLKLRTWPAAFSAAARASSTAEDRQNAFYNLAIFFATQNDAADMERSLRNALYWAPNWFKPHWALSRLLLKEGRLAEARQHAELAAKLDGGKDPEVIETLTAVEEMSRPSVSKK